jgi:hypothetical protein
MGHSYSNFVAWLVKRMFILRVAGVAALAWMLVFAHPATAASNAVLNPDHPQNYVVRQGDTLWDISARFLRDPWRWRDIWRGNPQVKNADLIYPGDILYLSYENGQPVIRSSREGRPVVKLSPRVRAGAIHSGAIPAIPVDAIQQFLSRPEVVGATELEDAGYIVSLGKERLVGGPGSVVYARGSSPEQGDRYTVVRQGNAYVDPDLDGDEAVLGYEATHIGDVTVTAHGDPSTLRLTSAKREVLVGDRLLPAAQIGALPSFLPHVPEKQMNGTIISVVEGVTQIGRHQVVVLNRGTQHGLNVGAVLAVFQRGHQFKDELAINPNAQLPEPDAQIELDADRQRGIEGLTMALDRFVRDTHRSLTIDTDDSYKDVTLPDERAGTIMVFRSFENLSYALVMSASRAMHLLDTVKNP